MSLSRRNRGLGAGIGTVGREEQARTGAVAPRVTPSFTLVITPILSPWIFMVTALHMNSCRLFVLTKPMIHHEDEPLLFRFSEMHQNSH